MASTIQRIDLSQRGFLSSSKAAEILDCSFAYLERLVQIGKLHPVVFGENKHGRLRYYKEAEIRKYKAEHPLLGQSRKRRPTPLAI